MNLTKNKAVINYSMFQTRSLQQKSQSHDGWDQRLYPPSTHWPFPSMPQHSAKEILYTAA